MREWPVELHPGFFDDVGAVGAPARWSARVFAAAYALEVQPNRYRMVHDNPPRPAYRVVFEHDRLIHYERFEDEQVVRVLYLWHPARKEQPDFERQWDELV